MSAGICIVTGRISGTLYDNWETAQFSIYTPSNNDYYAKYTRIRLFKNRSTYLFDYLRDLYSSDDLPLVRAVTKFHPVRNKDDKDDSPKDGYSLMLMDVYRMYEKHHRIGKVVKNSEIHKEFHKVDESEKLDF